MIEVPNSVWGETLDVFRTCGSGKRECVGYWVGEAGSFAVRRVVHPQHTATAWHYRVDDAWVTTFWIELAKSEESVLVQVHTHARGAGHSRTDDEGALVYQQGFHSLVLPGFALRDDCLKGAYLAVLDDKGRWSQTEVAEAIKWT